MDHTKSNQSKTKINGYPAVTLRRSCAGPCTLRNILDLWCHQSSATAPTNVVNHINNQVAATASHTASSPRGISHSTPYMLTATAAAPGGASRATTPSSVYPPPCPLTTTTTPSPARSAASAGRGARPSACSARARASSADRLLSVSAATVPPITSDAPPSPPAARPICSRLSLTSSPSSRLCCAPSQPLARDISTAAAAAAAAAASRSAAAAARSASTSPHAATARSVATRSASTYACVCSVPCSRGNNSRARWRMVPGIPPRPAASRA
eukprot:scaffold16454_cov117-Isochrysis_galbana.AAC.4